MENHPPGFRAKETQWILLDLFRRGHPFTLCFYLLISRHLYSVVTTIIESKYFFPTKINVFSSASLQHLFHHISLISYQIQMVPDLLVFDFRMVWKPYAFSRNCTLRVAFGSLSQASGGLSHQISRCWAGPAAPRQSPDHRAEQLIHV